MKLAIDGISNSSQYTRFRSKSRVQNWLFVQLTIFIEKFLLLYWEGQATFGMSDRDIRPVRRSSSPRRSSPNTSRRRSRSRSYENEKPRYREGHDKERERDRRREEDRDRERERYTAQGSESSRNSYGSSEGKRLSRRRRDDSDSDSDSESDVVYVSDSDHNDDRHKSDRRRSRDRDRKVRSSRDSRKSDKKSKKDKREKRDKEDKKSKKDKKDRKDKRSHHDDDKAEDDASSALPEKDRISSSDYFARNVEFSLWLENEKRLYFSDLTADQARKFFDKFVSAWNKGTLPSKFATPTLLICPIPSLCLHLPSMLILLFLTYSLPFFVFLIVLDPL